MNLRNQNHPIDLSEASRALNSNDYKTKQNGMRQIVNNFGKGYDCASINSQVAKLDLKKNVTLHRFKNIINDSYNVYDLDSAPEVIASILNQFENPNQQIKAFAVRQAGSFFTSETSSALIPIIRTASLIGDPYIRKAAAISILKIYQNNPNMVSRFNLDSVLRTLIDDNNPNVAANALSALTEINHMRDIPLIKISIKTIYRLLSSLENASEWSQIQIIDFITDNIPNDQSVNTDMIVQNLYTRLYQVNSGLTMAAIRCCLKMCLIRNDIHWTKEILSKIIQPLVSLLNNCVEIQYIVLRSITVILQQYKNILSDNVNFFFWKKDEPIYIKSEKVDIIWLLTTEQNAKIVLDEVTNYALDQEIKLSRKSIQVIGEICVSYESISDHCIDSIIALIQSRVDYIIQECIIISVNVLRRYSPQKKISRLISILCMNFNMAVSNSRAKAAMAWILGEFSDMIPTASEHIEAMFLDNFLEESNDVQLSILTAVVKLYLNNPESGKDPLRKILTIASNDIDNPDLKDHAILYLCLLSECSDQAKEIILNSKDDPPKPLNDMNVIDPNLDSALLPLIGSLAVMYKNLPSTFVPQLKAKRSASLDSSSSPAITVDHIHGDYYSTRIRSKSRTADDTTSTTPSIEVPDSHKQKHSSGSVHKHISSNGFVGWNEEIERQFATQKNSVAKVSKHSRNKSVNSNYSSQNTSENMEFSHDNAQNTFEVFQNRNRIRHQSFGQIKIQNQKNAGKAYNGHMRNEISFFPDNLQNSNQMISSKISSSSSDLADDKNASPSSEYSVTTDEDGTQRQYDLPLLAKATQANFLCEIYGSFEVNFLREIQNAQDKPKDDKYFKFCIKNLSDSSLTVTDIAIDKNIFSLAADTSTESFILPEIDNQLSSQLKMQETSPTLLPIVKSYLHKKQPFAPITINPNEISHPIIIHLICDKNRAFKADQDIDHVSIALIANRPSSIIFSSPLALPTILLPANEGGLMTKMEFMNHFQTVPENSSLSDSIDDMKIDSIDSAKQIFASQRIFFIAKKGNLGYFSGKTLSGDSFILILECFGDFKSDITVRMENVAMASIIISLLVRNLMN